MSTNITLAWSNRTDLGTLSGGSWAATLPLVNLQNRQVQKVARSTDLALQSTKWIIDLGAPYAIGVLALIVHNVSVTGKVRIVGADSAISLTNLIAYPLDFTNSAWTKGNITLTPNASTAPDGTGATTKVAATATAFASLTDSAPHFTVSTTAASLTCFVKIGSGATEANRFQLVNWTTVTVPLKVSVNYSTGAITYLVGSSGATMTALADGWWRLTLSTSTGITAGNAVGMHLCFCGDQTETAGKYAYIYYPELVASTGANFDGGWQPVWPSGMIPQNLLEWEDDNFWLGTLSNNARAGYQSPYISLLSSAQILRYWRVEIADTTNTDGYVQIGRLFMAATWVPSINYAYGAGLGYSDPTPVDTSLSGAEFFDVRRRFRTFNFNLEYILNSEAYAYALELQRLSGNSGEVLVIPDATDATNQPARAFVGRLLQLSPITAPKPSNFSVSFSIKELL
jgi:hypothetical protein